MEIESQSLRVSEGEQLNGLAVQPTLQGANLPYTNRDLS